MALIQEHREVQEVVRAQAGWVYACARRRVRNDALAEDVAQAVFILFWQKRASLGGEAKVTGWLYRAVGYCAGNALRLKQIRQRHEKEAAMAGLAGATGGEGQWSEVSPELEWAVDRLREKDRAAVLLRFYRQMSFAEVGQSLGISEEAARKRVDRALEKLRGVLAKKGVVAGVAALGVAMAENGTAAAPAGLVEAVTAAAGSGGTESAGIIAKGAIKMMAWAKMKVAAGVVAAGLLAGGTVVGIVAADGTTQPARLASEQGQTPLDALGAGKGFLKFAVKYGERVSFPEKYDGEPARDAAASLRDKIIAVHKRYWRNYAQIDQARFAFSSHTFLQGKPADIAWDMDAQVDMQYGHGIDVVGKNASGQPLHWALNREGLKGPAGGGDVSSLMLSMFYAHLARPEVCARFSSIEEDVALEGNDQARYDVLIGKDGSDVTREQDFYDCQYYFNRATGMLDRVVWCNRQVKEQYGHYPSIRMSYAVVDGVYIPTETVMDAPNKGAKIWTQKYGQVELRKRSVGG